jgi:hypothetical protein
MLIFLLGPSIAIFCHHDTRYFFAFSPALQAKVFRNPSERARTFKASEQEIVQASLFRRFPLSAAGDTSRSTAPFPGSAASVDIANRKCASN